jgi:hypothetical protein
MGLALGWSRYVKKPLRYLPVVVVLVWMIWGHAMYNGSDAFDRDAWVFVTAPLTQLAPWAFLLAAVGTAAFEWTLLRRGVTSVEENYQRRLHQVLPGWPKGGLVWLERWRLWLLCRDSIRQLAYVRLWLRAHSGDRQIAEEHILGIVPELEEGLAQLAPAPLP